MVIKIAKDVIRLKRILAAPEREVPQSCLILLLDLKISTPNTLSSWLVKLEFNMIKCLRAIIFANGLFFYLSDSEGDRLAHAKITCRQ